MFSSPIGTGPVSAAGSKLLSEIIPGDSAPVRPAPEIVRRPAIGSSEQRVKKQDAQVRSGSAPKRKSNQDS